MRVLRFKFPGLGESDTGRQSAELQAGWSFGAKAAAFCPHHLSVASFFFYDVRNK